MGRAPCCDKNGMKKGPWTPEEDHKLISFIQMNGAGNWRTLPNNAGLQRCGKSCRLRWTNYLRPDIKRGRFSFEEEETIIQLHSILGNKWSAIAAQLPGRTDNEIKNYWNTHIRKRLLRNGIDPVTHAPRLDLLELSTIISSALSNQSLLLGLSNLLGAHSLLSPELLRLANTLQTLKEENPEMFLQKSQDFELCNSIKQNQSLPLLPHTNNNINNAQIHQILSQEIPLSTPQNLSFQENLMPSDFVDPQLNIVYGNSTTNLTRVPEIPGMRNVQEMNYNGYNNQIFGVDSVISTPIASPEVPLNSSSTFVNSSTTTTEIDERGTYSSGLWKFEITESLDIEDFM